MSIIIKNTSTYTLQINDLGDTRLYGIDGYMAQSHQLDPNETMILIATDEAKNSVLSGDIKKHVDAGKLSVLEGHGYTLKQAVIAGKTVNGLLGLLDVVSVISVISITTATGAFATKALLDDSGYTPDYTVESQDVKCLTDQSANTLIVTYLTY